MRALTLTQPWAGLVAAGIKLVENRSRSMIKREDFGKRFAIHASREIDEDAYQHVYDIAPDLFDDSPSRIVPKESWNSRSRQRGAVLAVATLDRIVLRREDVDFELDGSVAFLDDQRRWFFGPVGYVLRDVVPLISGVPCRGYQGFWTLPAEVERAVLEQVE